MPFTICGKFRQCAVYHLLRDSVQRDVASLERGFKPTRRLTLQPGHDHNPRSDQIAVRKSVSHFIFDGIGEVMLASFFGARVTNLVAELDFHREAIVQGFQALLVAAPRAFGAIQHAAQNGLGVIIDPGDELHALWIFPSLMCELPIPSSGGNGHHIRDSRRADCRGRFGNDLQIKDKIFGRLGFDIYDASIAADSRSGGDEGIHG